MKYLLSLIAIPLFFSCAAPKSQPQTQVKTSCEKAEALHQEVKKEFEEDVGHKIESKIIFCEELSETLTYAITAVDDPGNGKYRLQMVFHTEDGQMELVEVFPFWSDAQPEPVVPDGAIEL